MKTQSLPVESMLPRVSLCRLFDTQATSDWAFRHRISDFYELSYYLEGDGSVTINNKTYNISAGDIRFTKPGTSLCGTPHFKSYTIYFDFGTSKTIYNNEILDGIPEFFHASEEYSKQFEKLLQSYTSNELSAPARKNALLLLLLSDLFESIYSLKDCSTVVKSCINYMEENYAKNITLESLCAFCGYSKSHILRLFAQDLGCSPHHYLTSLRMNHAKLLLTETDLSLNVISSECGFFSDSHFKTLFKKTTGFTPGNYRSKVNK